MRADYFGERLAEARKESGFTQEQLAARIGVTPQAVSKWEKGNSYPDLDLLYYICDLLNCSSDYLLQRDDRKVRITESNDEAAARQLLGLVLAEPLTLEAGNGCIELLTQEYDSQFQGIRSLRERIAAKYGFLLPLVRIRDNADLKPLEFRILAYDKLLYIQELETLEGDTFSMLCKQLEVTVVENFDKIVNRQMIQTLVENVAEKYPAVVQGVIPEKVSLKELQEVLTLLVMRKKSIRNLVKIIEIIEGELVNSKDEALIAEKLIEKLAL